MPPSEGSTSTSQSLERGLAILSSFNSDRPLIGVSELSRDLDLSRSTAHRYIATLAQLGYLQQDPDSKRYRLGPRVLDLGFSAINSMDLREISAPHLRQLSDETGYTVNLAILDDVDVVYIERCRTARPGQRDIDLNLHVGARLPAYCTAMGKAILAFLPEDRLAEIMEQIDFAPRGTEHAHRSRSLPGGAGKDPCLGHRRQRRGARLRPALDRGPDPLTVGRGRRGAQPRSPPDDGGDGRADRTLRPRGHPDGTRHLPRHGTQAGACLMVPPPRQDPGILWTPPADVRETTEIGRYLTWLERQRGLSFPGFDDLWRWSVDDLPAFWSSIWDFFEVRSAAPYTTVLASETMPGATWFPDARLNFAEHMVGGDDDTERAAIVSHSQTRDPVELTFGELRAQVARARAGLMRLGVGPGDRVVAYMPNIPETLVAFVATASLGAVWASCAPELGARSVVDRLVQLEPDVLLAVDGYGFRDRSIDRRAELATIRAALPTLRHVVHVPYGEHVLPDAVSWQELLAEPGPLAFLPVPFDHPLFVLFSSGTTGRPKAIVHGHGGILLELLKAHALSWDLKPGRPPAVVQHDVVDDVERARRGAPRAVVDRDARRRPRPGRTSAGNGGWPRRRGRPSWV